MSDSVRPHGLQPTRLLRAWDFPGKSTGVGCHFLRQCMKVKSESEVTQSSPNPCDPMVCSPAGSSIHGIFPAESTGVGCHCLLLRLKSSPTSQKGSLFHFIWHPLFWMIPVLWLSFFEILFSFISWAAQDLSSDMWT